MASSEHPQTSPLTHEAPTEAASISLPPLPQTPAKDATKFLRLRGWLDAMLIVLVLLFAFLAASFPVFNSDFFRQLATGRLIVQGQYHFGVDPFVYTADDIYFVNHSWLFALLMYGLYQIPAGGAVVVIFKAVLIAGLAVVLLCTCRREGQSLWIPAACTALAILVASPRFSLHLQSTCLSFLFLGLTLWLLTAADKSEKQVKRLWLLPPLFALWVNCDSWFFLGPLTVALYLIGALIRSWFSEAGAKPQMEQRYLAILGTVLGVGVSACTFNPHGARALTLPPAFGRTAAGGLLEHDPQFYPLFLSPLAKDYYKPYFGLSAAGLAYWPLLLLGLVSFVVVFNRVPWPRLLVWMGFALLSLYNWQAIPFFAIVAGPITAMNWLDFVAQRLGSAPHLTPAWRNWSLGGRALTLLFGLVLLIATVPGWLQKSQPPFHRIGWGVRVDPSLQAMAETIHRWREAGLLPEEPHWFNMHSEIANYLAWYAPGERVFLDQSLPDFRQAAEDYLAISQGLEQETEAELAALKTDWRQILRDRHVRYWIFDNISTRKADLVARAVLFSRSEEWILYHLQGRIAVFARRDPKQPAPAPSTRLALDLKRSAFGPVAETAPPHGVEPAPPRDWWHTCLDVWWHPEPPLSSDRESIALYDYYHQVVEKPRQAQMYTRVWQASVAAGVVAGSGPMPNSLPITLLLSWACTYHDLLSQRTGQPMRQQDESDKLAIQVWTNYVNSQVIEPPSLYLAIRAARRALLVDPEDGPTYFRLGLVYQNLRDLPQERLLREQPFSQLAPSLLDAIRRTQLAAAYQNSLYLQSDNDRAAHAHQALCEMYLQLGFIDAAVHQLRQAIDERKASGPLSGMSPTQHNQMLDQMSAQLSKLDGELERRLNRYEVNAATKSGLEKVKVALQEGLSETALTALEQEAGMNISGPAELSVVKVLVAVLLDLGRLDKARELLPELEGQPAKPEDLNLYVRLAAARGDYAEADRLLDDALRHAWQPPPGQLRMPDAAARVGSLVGQVLLSNGRHMMDFWRRRWGMQALLNGLAATRQEAEWNLIRGWLALEAGHCGEARKHFQSARDVTVPAPHWAPEINRLNALVNPQMEIRDIQQLGIRHAVLHDHSLRYLRWLKEK